MQHLTTIPTIPEYDQLLETCDFREMEQYSASFLTTNFQALAPYRRKWTRDPFHQWSRQWEYPYVFSKIRGFLSSGGISCASILDAGSGATFFPYFVKSQMPRSSVTCVDSDERLCPVFEQINKHSQAKVNFAPVDITSIPFDDGSFDIIYCISVLEHLKGHATIIREFRRLLRDRGALIATFDISVDGSRDISIPRAQQLVDDICRIFPNDHGRPVNIAEALRSPNILTTTAMARRDRKLVPWRNPITAIASTILKRHLPRSLGYPKLTCLAYVCVKA